MSDAKQNLDGSTPITPVPFDAHEQAQAAQAADYEHAEFPKAVDHVDHPSGVGLQPVVVNSAEEEAAYREAKAEAEPKPAKAAKPTKAESEKKSPKLADFDAE